MKNVDILKEMGIQPWYERKTQIKKYVEMEKPLPSYFEHPLYKKINNCHDCGLATTRLNVVFGAGVLDAKIMVIGEAPGAEEDKQAIPFVGKSGQLLTKMLAAININRADIFIANVLKCRPPENADPTQEQIAKCKKHLDSQIELILPKFMLAFGRIAGNHLLGSNNTMANLRGRVYEYGKRKIPLLITYHPAYLLYQPSKKADAWQDLKKARILIDKFT
jgi:uracil-DNA glycosylase